MRLHRLQIVPPPPPLPTFDPGPIRRPGERREPLPGVMLSSAFAESSANRGLALEVATELTVERALVLLDFELIRLKDLFPGLLAAAAQQRFTVPLPGPYRRYRASLLAVAARQVDDAEPEATVTVPLRFFPRVLELAYERAFNASALDEAITLELAALCIGRTMSEYALLFASANSR